MKKFSSTMVATITSAGMPIGVGTAIAQIPDPTPSGCPTGQRLESVDGAFQCIDDTADPDPRGSLNDSISPGVGDTQTYPDGSPCDMGKINPATGAYGAHGTPNDSSPTPGPGEDTPENDGIPPGVDDIATRPDGSLCDISKIDPVTGVYGYCPTPDDETPGDDGNPGDDESPGDDVPGDNENLGDEQPGGDENPREDENPGGEDPDDRPDVPKSGSKKAGIKNTGLAVAGIQATALGGTALALLVGGVTATRFARESSEDS